MKIGEKIRKIRNLKGMSQQALAEVVEISQKQLSRIEMEQVSPTFELLEKICKTLDVSLKSLLEFNDKIVFNNYTANQQGGKLVTTMPISNRSRRFMSSFFPKKIRPYPYWKNS